MKNNIKGKFIKNRDDFLINISRHKNVLHIGCCDDPYTELKLKNNNLLHAKLFKVSRKITGIDISSHSIDIMKKYNYKVYNVDLNKKYLKKKFDIIIFGETIEHLENPGLVLENIRKMMSFSTKLIITTPNPFFLVKFLDAFLSIEYNHKDHLVAFTPQTLKQILRKKKIKTEEIYYSYMNRSKYGIRTKISKFLSMFFNPISENLIFVCKIL